MKKNIKIYDGIEVDVNETLLDDFDYISDLSKARKAGDIAELISMYFALVGGEDVYAKVREKIVKEKGYFSQEELLKVIKKIDETFPKAGTSAKKRW